MLAIAATLFASCSSSDSDNDPGVGTCYVVNYGAFNGAKSSISVYDKESDIITNDHYETVNTVSMISNVQYAYNYDGNVYMMGNNADQVFWIDNKSWKQTANGLEDDIIKPRYCVADGNYLYVSCWGGDIWTDITLSYIAKVDLDTKKVVKKIALEGGPEGLAIVDGKLYAALNYKKNIAVIDLDTEDISYIETQAVSSYLIKDDNNNLYASQVSSYSSPSTETGLAYINTTTNEYELLKLEGISSSYVNIMSFNNDFSKLYVMTSAYDASYNISGAIAVLNTESKSFAATNLVEGISGINGVGFYDNKVCVFTSSSTTSNGKFVTYDTEGTLIKEYETGIAPFMLLEIK
ncbi:glutaminyl-peptide cyclotransferase [Marinifilum sp. D737]|nr:glutaminyl-peptide cyclotransferase [Marinifilum sp. D737]